MPLNIDLSRKNKILIFIVLMIIIGLTVAPPKSYQKSVTLSQKAQGGIFSFETLQGEKKLSELPPAILLYFGYTYCPDICPTTLMNWKQALAQVKDVDFSKLGLLFITVDPERDTLKKVHQYGEFFHPQIQSGHAMDLEKLMKMYRIGIKRFYPNKKDQENYVIDHTTHFFLISNQGEILKTIPHHTPVKKLANLIQSLMQGETK